MQNFKVRTYDVQQATPKNRNFILNRGRNAGKPLQEPCPNCFILYCSSLEEMENVLLDILRPLNFFTVFGDFSILNF